METTFALPSPYRCAPEDVRAGGWHAYAMRAVIVASSVPVADWLEVERAAEALCERAHDLAVAATLLDSAHEQRATTEQRRASRQVLRPAVDELTALARQHAEQAAAVVGAAILRAADGDLSAAQALADQLIAKIQVPSARPAA